MHKEQRGEKVWRCFWEKCVKEAAIGKAAPNVIRRGVEFPGKETGTGSREEQVSLLFLTLGLMVFRQTLSLTGSPPCPWWHRIAVGVGWTGNIVLTIAVIALGVWGK